MADGTARQAYLDRVRGLAVLIMIEAHVLDSWTRVSDRAHPGFGYAMLIGGMGAPLFLFLAGVASVLSAESKTRKAGDSAAAWRDVRYRGWQIFGLAFLFRFQSYLLGGGTNPAGLLKVDILNVMGPAIVLTAITGRATAKKWSRGLLFVAVATAIAMLTPIVRVAPALSWLPDPVEWYFRPSPGRTNFTLFPWAGFVFAGATVGVILDQSRIAGKAVRFQIALAGAAALLGSLAYLSSFLPSIYARSDFWTSSPSFFFLRAVLITLTVPAAFFWERAPWRGKITDWSLLETFGRASLFVYWVHVEMVYGFLSRPLRRSLSWEQVLVAYVLFTAFLLVLVVLKNRFAEGRSNPSLAKRRATPASI
jgi:uncharacterized membrane protein